MVAYVKCQQPLVQMDLYEPQQEHISQILSYCLTQELLCLSRYKTHYYRALELQEHVLAKEFLIHAADEQRHAEMLSVRIDQIGSNSSQASNNLLSKATSQSYQCEDIVNILVENLVAERTTISMYKRVIKYLEPYDPTSCKILRIILEKEQKHADQLLIYLHKYRNKDERVDVVKCLKKTAASLGDEIRRL